MSAMHRLHPASVAVGELDPDCERCREHTIGSLDDEHLLGVCGHTRRELNDEFGQDGPFAAFWDSIIRANALKVQLRYRETTRGQR